METTFIVMLDYLDPAWYFNSKTELDFIIVWISTTLSRGGRDDGCNTQRSDSLKRPKAKTFLSGVSAQCCQPRIRISQTKSALILEHFKEGRLPTEKSRHFQICFRQFRHLDTKVWC